MKTKLLNYSKSVLHCLGVPLVLLALLLAGLKPAVAQVPPPLLFTSAPSFVSTNHILSTTVFHWFPGQVSGPWVPMGGLASWNGTPAFWQGQIKQMMLANIDMLYVHQYADANNPNLLTTNYPAGGTDPQLVNFFTAMSQLRAQGYDVPKIAPYLDPQITWNATTVDLSTTAGKDAWANQYIRFYNMYYSVNTDTNADTYLARISNQPILDVWNTDTVCLNANSLARTDVSSRLVAALGAAHPCFTNGFVQVGCAASPSVSFEDIKLYQFEITAYNASINYNGIGTMQLKSGYWDQNIRTPGSFLARAGGVNYSNAWNNVSRSTTLLANLESWNEYDEGSGNYAGTNAPPYLINGNPNTDTWSTTGDPFEYIKTTARNAAIFCDVPAQASKMLWSSIPATLMPGDSRTVTIIVRNAGSALWNNASNYKLSETDASPMVSGGHVLIDDTQDEIPLYGGIFRGRAKAFTFTITAPATVGTYTNHFQMLQEGVAWFGDTLTNVITVKSKTAATVTLGNLSQVADGYNTNPVTATTTPSGLTVNVTYNGSPYAPVVAGSYTVVGIIDDANYYGGATNTLVVTGSSIPNPIPNLSFEANPIGTTVNAPLGGGSNVVDSTTITGWRFVNGDPAHVGLTATIITNASAGKQALRLDSYYDGTVGYRGGSVGFGWVDQWAPPMQTPVVVGQKYLVSVDAAWISGDTVSNVLFAMLEFNSTGTYLAQGGVLGVSSVSSTGYTTYSFMWTPLNPGTARTSFEIIPVPSGGTVSLSVDNVKITPIISMPIGNSPSPINLATNGTAMTCSSGYGTAPWMAIDGNRDGNFGHGSVWHSLYPSPINPWYQVNLGGMYYLDRVQIFPRTDNYPTSGNVRNFTLTVLDDTNGVVWQETFLTTAADAAINAWGSSAMRGVRGSKVRLDRLDNSIRALMAFAEMEVWGQATPVATNIALNMPATASTPDTNGTAIANGNDGNIDSDYGHEACIYNSASAAVGNFWQVDLQSTNQIGRVNIYSRSDTNMTTFVRLSVLDGSSNVVYAVTNDIGKADVLVENAPQYDIPIGLPAGVVGRYVKIETLLSEHLVFGEIEVFPSIVPAMSSTPTNIVFSVSGGNTLHLTWPGSYLGWIAQSNSVSLANTNYWFDIAGSASVTNLTIPISPATPQVFYRLRLP